MFNRVRRWFSGNISNAVTNDSYALTDDRLLELLSGAGRTASGIAVTPENAQRVSAVFACVDKISGAIASMPINIGKMDGRVFRPIDDHPLDNLLNIEPCARYSSNTFWRYISDLRLLRGDGFALIERDALGNPKNIIPLAWEGVSPEQSNPSIFSRNYYRVNDGLKTKVYDQDDILHFPSYGFDGLRSMSVISYGAREATGNAKAMDSYAGQFFRGGAHPSIVLEHPKKMEQSAIDLLRTTFAERYAGLDNAHKLPLVLTDGLKVEKISLSAADAQLLEARKFQVIEIARAFGVPPHMIGETSASTSWGSGLDAINRGFLTHTLHPHFNAIENELRRKLVPRSNIKLEFDRTSLLDGDAKSQAEYFRAALGGPGAGKGWMTPNEVRRRTNNQPIPGEDELFDPGKFKGGQHADSTNPTAN